MSEEPWKALQKEAFGHPIGSTRVALLAQAVEAAEAEGSSDGADRTSADLRLLLIREAELAGDPVSALAAYALLRSRFEAQPERYGHLSRDLDGKAKWMPTLAISHPGVPLARIEGLIEELERHHEAAGSGRRAALGVRLTLLRHVGDPGGRLPGTLAEWRAVNRGRLADCEACERLEESESLVFLGEHREALAVLEPAVNGRLRFCKDGSAKVLVVTIPLLLEFGRRDDARRVLKQAVRDPAHNASTIEIQARLARLSAAAGRPEEGARLVMSSMRYLGLIRSPLREFQTCCDGVAALGFIERAGIDTLVLEGSPPAWLGPRRAIGLSELRQTLDRRADELATAFDRRNETDHQRRLLDEARNQESLDSLADPLPTAARDSLAAPVDLPPTATPSGRWDRDTGPAPSDPATWEAWARRQQDRFRFDLVGASAEQIWTDTTADVALRATVFLVAVLDGDIGDLVTHPNVPKAIQLRLLAWEAQRTITKDLGAARAQAVGAETQESEASSAEIARPEKAIIDDAVAEARRLPDDDPGRAPAMRTSLSVAARIAVVIGDGEQTAVALERLCAEDAFDQDTVLDLLRWRDAADGWSQVVAVDGSDVYRDAASLALDRALAASQAARDSWPGFAAATAYSCAGLALQLHRNEDAETAAQQVETLVGPMRATHRWTGSETPPP